MSEGLVERIRALIPTIAAKSFEAEAARRPLDEVIDALKATGVFRSFVAKKYGGYEIEERPFAGRPIPLGVDEQPSIPTGKYTSAADLGRLLEYLHLAAGGTGPLIRRFGGAVTPTEARYLLYLLVHVVDTGKLDRYLPRAATVAHKAGWIDTARHDNGLVYWGGGSFVVAVMTYNAGGAGTSSDVLAGTVAKAALTRFKVLDGSS